MIRTYQIGTSPFTPINSFLAYAMGEEEISLKAKTKDSTDDRTSTADRRNAR